MERHYYKAKDGKSWYSLKTPDFADNPDYIEISEQEWNEHIAELEAQAQEE